MIIRVEGSDAEQIAAARHRLEQLGQRWGLDLKETTAPASSSAEGRHDNNKVIDPVSLAALALSIPSAALAVIDLTDRIKKRRRAEQLIEQAAQLATQHVTITLISQRGALELAGLQPDQLLDLFAADNDAST